MESLLECFSKIKKTVEKLFEIMPGLSNKKEYLPLKIPLSNSLVISNYVITFELEVNRIIHHSKQIHVFIQLILKNIKELTLLSEIIELIILIKKESNKLRSSTN